MQFLVYSDIHHDCYNNGITLDDTINIENQITQYAIDNNIQYILFLGDWYRATNPVQRAIKAAEATWKDRSTYGITTIALVGNHDRETKSALSNHAFQSANIFNNDLKNVRVIEDVQRFELEGVHFFCIPSGYERHPMVTNFVNDHYCPLVVLFHGLVAGSALARGSSASSGIHPNILRKLEADYIIGGDNHTPQDLTELLGCPSRYVGAPLQHNWGDREQSRGFWHMNYEHLNKHPILNTGFISSIAPRFVRKKLEAINDMDAVMKLTALLQHELQGNEGIVEITFIGKYANSLNIELLENAIKQYRARKCRIIIDRTYEKIQIVPGVSESIQPEDKWNAWVNGINTKELNPSLLSEMGKWAIQEARRII